MQDITDIQTHTHTHTHLKAHTIPSSQQTEKERGHDIECQERQTTLHDAPPTHSTPLPTHFFSTEIVPRTEEPHWTTSRLQRLPHNKSAGKQVHHLRLLDPEREARIGTRATLLGSETSGGMPTDEERHRAYDEFMHRVQSGSIGEKLHTQFGPRLQIASAAGIKGKLSFGALQEWIISAVAVPCAGHCVQDTSS